MKQGKANGWVMEICQFYIAHNCDRISVYAQAMWHYLMYRANENWWNYPLCLNIPEIAYATKMSISNVKRSRDELTQKGFIRWVSQGGSKPAKYYIISRTGSTYAGQKQETQIAN